MLQLPATLTWLSHSPGAIPFSVWCSVTCVLWSWAAMTSSTGRSNRSAETLRLTGWPRTQLCRCQRPVQPGGGVAPIDSTVWEVWYGSLGENFSSPAITFSAPSWKEHWLYLSIFGSLCLVSCWSWAAVPCAASLAEQCMARGLCPAHKGSWGQCSSAVQTAACDHAHWEPAWRQSQSTSAYRFPWRQVTACRCWGMRGQVGKLLMILKYRGEIKTCSLW